MGTLRSGKEQMGHSAIPLKSAWSETGRSFSHRCLGQLWGQHGERARIGKAALDRVTGQDGRMQEESGRPLLCDLSFLL